MTDTLVLSKLAVKLVNYGTLCAFSASSKVLERYSMECSDCFNRKTAFLLLQKQKMATGKPNPSGFRLPMVSSSYHQKCIASSVKAIEEAAVRTTSGEKTHPSSAYRDCNNVAQNKRWVESVHKELVAARSW